MRSQQLMRMLKCGEQKLERQRKAFTQSRLVQWLIFPLFNSAKALHRRRLVSSLIEQVIEIRGIDNGYALRFHCSSDQDNLDDLIGKMSKYIIFESRNAPYLTFTIVEDPSAQAVWLQVRNIVFTSPNSIACTPFDHSEFSRFSSCINRSDLEPIPRYQHDRNCT